MTNIGICKICNNKCNLSRDHFPPRSSGNIHNHNIYSGKDIFNSGHSPKYERQSQGGYTIDDAICSKCNNFIGGKYDKAMIDFYNYCQNNIKLNLPNSVEPKEWLKRQTINIQKIKLKPSNISKRALAALLSIADISRINKTLQEVRRTVSETSFKPALTDVSLYTSLYLERPTHFSEAIIFIRNQQEILYCGIESGVLSFYLAPKNEHLKGGFLSRCTDITEWAIAYDYNKEYELSFELNFNKSALSPLRPTNGVLR